MQSVFYDERAERAVLALIVSDPDRQAILGTLCADDFCKDAHQKIFATMQGMWAAKQPIDLITLDAALRETYGAYAGDQLTSVIVDCATKDTFGASWAVDGHIAQIKSAALRRRMAAVLDAAKQDVADPTSDVMDVLDRTRQRFRDMTISTHAWQTAADVLMASYEAVERRSRGEEKPIPTGLPPLDRVTTGLHRGEMTILGARPAVGKSALGGHIALSAAGNGFKVGVCSREMSDVQYGARMLARGSGVRTNRLRAGNLNGDEWPLLADAMGQYAMLPISFLFSARYIEDVRAQAQEKADRGELDLLIVDYLQLLQSRQRFDAEYLRIAHISKALKDLSVDCGIAVLALAQVGRSAQNAMPTLAELRGGGDMEQDADNVIFLHRPADATDHYVRPRDRDIFEALQNAGLQYIAIHIAKQRQGETGVVAAVFNPEKMIFTAIEEGCE